MTDTMTLIRQHVYLTLILLCLIHPAICTSTLAPDYHVLSVEIPVAESTTSPGGILHPSLEIINTGQSDTRTTNVTINGSLNTLPLIPIHNTIMPLASGEAKKTILEYKIPPSIAYGAYTFSITIDPEHATGDLNPENNTQKAGGILSITPPDDDRFIGCEACWKGYK